MITFLASPKPFIGIAKEHQFRAIKSWQASCVNAEIILYGNSTGIDEAAAELGVNVVKEIASTSSGVPYFSSIVNHATDYAKHDLQIYLNCDILLTGYLQTVKEVEFEQFLLIGQRMDLSEGMVIDLTEPEWLKALEHLAQKGNVTLYPPSGIDYFGFRRGLWKDLSPIVIGRAGYDNALLAYCLRCGVPIIDATFSVVALHQYHNYKHLIGGQQAVWTGEDAINNINYAGGRKSLPILSDANYVLNYLGIKCQVNRRHWLRKLQLKLRYEADCPKAALIPRAIYQFLHGIGFRFENQHSLNEVLDNLKNLTK